MEAKRPEGRPSMGLGSTHGPRVQIRLTPATMERVRAAARRHGMTLSEWIRDAIERRLGE